MKATPPPSIAKVYNGEDGKLQNFDLKFTFTIFFENICEFHKPEVFLENEPKNLFGLLSNSIDDIFALLAFIDFNDSIMYTK